MKRYQTIIVAAALDDRDTATLQWAAHFARAAQSKFVYVAHVAPSFDLPPEAKAEHPGLVVPLDEGIEQQLRAMVGGQPDLFPAATEVRFAVRQGALATEIVRLAAQKSADLVCLGRKLGDDDDLAAAAVKIVRKSPCSVFVLPAGAPADCRRILVPIDFSDHAREALDVAAAVGTYMLGSAITALHVYSVPIGYHKTGRSYEDFARSMKRLAAWQWDKFGPGSSVRNVPCQIRLELSERVPQAILGVANELNADLIVMATHGRTGPAGVLLGQVAEAVCARSTHPLLFVKRKGEVVTFLHGLLQLLELESRD